MPTFAAPPTRPELLEILDGYGLGPAGLRWRVLPRGEDNLNLRLETDGGVFVLRRYRRPSAAAVDWELEVVDRLCGAGFPTAPVLRRRDGRLRGELAGGHAALFRLVPGRHPRACTLWAGERVGEALARLGLATRGTAVSGSRPTEVHRLRGFLDVVATVPVADPDLGALVAAVEEGLSWLQAQAPALAALPSGVVHHDAHEGNVLLDGERDLVAVLDFDEAYAGPLVTDVARLLSFWAKQRIGGPLLPHRARRLLAAYERHRPLTATERALLPDFLRLTVLTEAAGYVSGAVLRDPHSRPVPVCRSWAAYLRLVAEPLPDL